MPVPSPATAPNAAMKRGDQRTVASGQGTDDTVHGRPSTGPRPSTGSDSPSTVYRRPSTGSDSASTAHRLPSTGASALTPFEREVVVVFVDLLQLLGMPKSYGEIYGLLFASGAPLSLADIQEKLGISKGSVSQGVRALRELGAVRLAAAAIDGGDQSTVDSRQSTTDGAEQNPVAIPSTVPGRLSTGPDTVPSTVHGLPSTGSAPRAYYVPVLELRQLTRAFLQGAVEPQLAASRDTLRHAGALLSTDAGALPPEQRELLFRRLEKLQTWHRRAEGLLPWAVRFLG